jgi:hypothetical protein
MRDESTILTNTFTEVRTPAANWKEWGAVSEGETGLTDIYQVKYLAVDFSGATLLARAGQEAPWFSGQRVWFFALPNPSGCAAVGATVGFQVDFRD